MPYFSWNSVASGSRSFSAPTMAYLRCANCSFVQRRTYDAAERRRADQHRRLVASRRARRWSWRPSDSGGRRRPRPGAAGTRACPVKPNEWKNGSTPMKQSVGPIGKICASESTLARMLACVSITPFGTPVLPLEKMIVASGADGRRTAAVTSRRSQRSAASAAPASSADDLVARRRSRLRRSSRKTMPGHLGEAGLRRGTACDVRIVRMPAWSIGAVQASGPIVKFRLTGTLAGEEQRDVGERARRPTPAAACRPSPRPRVRRAEHAAERERADERAAVRQLLAGACRPSRAGASAARATRMNAMCSRSRSARGGARIAVGCRAP